jgi:hypothetical protein
MSLLLLVVLVLLLCGGLSNWGSDNNGYGSSGIRRVIFIVFIGLFLTGRP